MISFSRSVGGGRCSTASGEAGVIWVNCLDHGDMTQPWGGYKQSGFGRDKCFETMLAHTQTKSVWIHLG